MLTNVLRAAVLFAVVLACCACEGQIGGVTEFIGMIPTSATLRPNGTQELRVGFLEAAANEIEWSVLEPGGGTIVPDMLPYPPKTATYTAPATPGTYHVRAHVVTNNREQTVECGITVVP